jgi:putative ABC transport system permease protein
LKTWWAASARHLLRHPVQLGLAVLGLALGVATIAAVALVVASARRGFELSLDEVNGAATHQLVGGALGIPELHYVALRRSTDGAELAPVVEGYATVAGRSVHVLGIDPFADPSFRRFGALESSGDLELLRRWLTEPGAAMVSHRTARMLGVTLDQQFTLEIAGRRNTATVVALLRENRAGLDDLVLTDVSQAQEWLGLMGRLSRIDVKIAPGDTGVRQLARWRAQLPAGVEFVVTERRSREAADLTDAFMTNLRAMSLLALLVGSFLIYNSMSFALLQRRHTLGVLRALGVTRGEVLSIVLAEAAVLGAVGSALGAAAGVWLARHLLALVTRTINDLYFVSAVNEISLEPATLLVALGVGVTAAMLAALLPALEATHTVPQLSLRRSALEQRVARGARGLVVISLTMLVGAGLVIALSDRSLVAGFLALLLLLLAAAFLTPAVLRALAILAGRMIRGSVTATLALRDVAASLSRTGVAVAALSVAITAAIGVAVMVTSFRLSLSDWLGRTLRADIYVTAPGPGFSRPERAIETSVVRSLIAHEAVTEHSATRRVAVESPLGPVLLDAIEPASRSYGGFTLVDGQANLAWPAFDRGDVLVTESFAFRHRLAAGDSISLLTPAGPRRFRIAGTFRDYGNDRGAVLMKRAIYRAAWSDDAITSMGLYLAPGSDADAVIASLHAATRARQDLFIRSNGELRALSMQIFERTFAITRILYWLATAVAAIGLLSALLAYELERMRELAILRALGVTPAGVGRLIETQTLFLGVVAALVAVPTGLAVALVLIEVINRRAFGWRIEWHLALGDVVATLLIAVAAALLAGLYPAWRSSRASIAAHIREE